MWTNRGYMKVKINVSEYIIMIISSLDYKETGWHWSKGCCLVHRHRKWEGEVLNSVFTASEGEGIRDLFQGLVHRYNIYGKTQPEVIYVDRDCCCVREGEVVKLADMFSPCSSAIRLNIWHFMPCLAAGVTDMHSFHEAAVYGHIWMASGIWSKAMT